MLRPSAFSQNNGNSEASSSKSILRPSSFQLATSSLSSPKNTEKKPDADEPSTTSSETPFQLNDESTSKTPDSGVSGSSDGDAKITSTTNNGGESSGESNEEVKVSSNPFCKATSHDDDSDTEAPKVAEEAKAKRENSSPAPSADSKNLFASSTKNLFAAASSKAPQLNNGSESNFVFGQNIHERIVGAKPDTSTPPVDESKSDSCSGSELFAAAAAAAGSSKDPASTSSPSTSSSNGNGAESKETSRVEDLTKVAREYEESRAQKRKLDAVETFTGEENEKNVLEISGCKLFAFVASNWEQRGPGSLRLNDVKPTDDNEDTHSRVVFRTLGNFRVLLNTKVWDGMVVEKPSQKSLRLTAIDTDGQIKIYLIMARPDDVSSLYTALKKRIESAEPAAKRDRSS